MVKLDKIVDNRTEKLNETGKFNFTKDIKVGKGKRKVLEVIKEKETDYLSLCKTLDIKPSKLDKKLEELQKCGLVSITKTKISITKDGIDALSKSKDQMKKDKKFKKFINVLSDEEFEKFYGICDSLQFEDNKEDKKV